MTRKRAGAPLPRPRSRRLSLSEAEAEAGDDLMTIEALLVVRVAILCLGVAVGPERHLDAAADPHAVEILAFLEVERRPVGAVLIVEIGPGVGVAGLAVDEHVRAHRGSGPAADIEVPARGEAQLVADKIDVL